MTRHRPLLVAALLASTLAGCATGGASTTTTLLPQDALPASAFATSDLADLRVEPAQVTDQVDGRAGLLVATGLWRVLEDGEVVATVQLGDVVGGVEDLQRHLLAQFGAVPPRAVRVGDHVVHVAAGNGRTDTFALVDDRLMIVSVDDAFTRRRALVRHLIDILGEEAP